MNRILAGLLALVLSTNVLAQLGGVAGPLTGAATGSTFGTPVLAPDGVGALPGYAFASQPSTGWWRPNTVTLYGSINGLVFAQFVSGDGAYFTDRIGLGNAADAFLQRDAANTLAQRNGVNAQAFRLYNTFTDAANYERLQIEWSANVAFIHTGAVGTGVPRDLNIGTQVNSNLALRTNNAARWQVTSAGHFLGQTDNTYDIGASAATRPRNLYVGSAIFTTAPTTYTATTYTVLATDNYIIANGAAGSTVTLPAASTNTGRSLTLKCTTAFAVASATANVVLRQGGAAQTAVLGAVAGSWAQLVSDGVNWVIMAGS